MQSVKCKKVGKADILQFAFCIPHFSFFSLNTDQFFIDNFYFYYVKTIKEAQNSKIFGDHLRRFITDLLFWFCLSFPGDSF